MRKTPIRRLRSIGSILALPLAACAADGGAEGTEGATDVASGTEAGGTQAPGSSDGGDTGADGSGGPVTGGTTGDPEGTDGTAETGTDSGGPVVCPTEPPFDRGDARLVEQCTQPLWVIGGDDSRVTFSVDEGQSWLSVYINDTDGDDFVNDIFVYAGVFGAIGRFGLYIDRGRGFELVESVDHQGFDTYGGQFTVADDQILLTTNAGTYVSADGITWTSLDPFPGGEFPAGFGGHFHGTAFGDGTYVVFQDQAFRRFDGATWSQDALPGAPNVRGAAFGLGQFVAVGTLDSAGWSRVSTDGLDWSDPQTTDEDGQPLANVSGGVVFDGRRFFMYTRYAGNQAYTSSDGMQWTSETLSQPVHRVAYDDGTFIGAGDGDVSTSQDGITWTQVHVLAPEETSNINGPRVAIGPVLL